MPLFPTMLLSAGLCGVPLGPAGGRGRQEQAGPLVRPQGLLSSTAAGQRAPWAVADLTSPRSGRLAVEAGGGDRRGQAVLDCLTARPGASQVSVPPSLCWVGAGRVPQHLACAGHSFDVYQVKGGRETGADEGKAFSRANLTLARRLPCTDLTASSRTGAGAWRGFWEAPGPQAPRALLRALQPGLGLLLPRPKHHHPGPRSPFIQPKDRACVLPSSSLPPSPLPNLKWLRAVFLFWFPISILLLSLAFLGPGCPRTWLIFITTIGSRCCFTGGETEAQTGSVICPRPHSALRSSEQGGPWDWPLSGWPQEEQPGPGAAQP